MNTNQYNSYIKPTWCPGCGNFGIMAAVKNALTELSLGIDDVCFFYDVGCSSNWADFFQTYGFHGLHGRGLLPAVGASLSHHKMPMIAILGDGGGYGEGLNHFVAAVRANYNLTMLVTNNQLYSLTTGQKSPTTQQGRKTKSTPFGVIEKEFNPLLTAIANQASFVARGFTGEMDHLKNLITKAIKHQGFGYLDILQPCITFNKKQPLDWYKKRVYKLEKEGYSWQEALEKANQAPEKLGIGVFYKQNRPSYQQSLPQLKEKLLINQSIERINIEELIKEFI